MKTEQISIRVGESDRTSAITCIPEDYQPGKGAAVLISHGAGNDMNNPLIVAVSEGLAQAGYLTLRFNFLYKEKGRKTPDPENKLVLTWQSAFRFLKEDARYAPQKCIAAGKSMGGRIASQMVADGALPVEGLILYGYPLHAPGKKEKLRDAHLYRINIPMLFFAGTRDALCDLALLKSVLTRLQAPWKLEIVEGGDHSFQVPKKAGASEGQVHGQIVKKSIAWLQE
jgi:predicted alpha/beta-hydrolase family hydrolase